MDEKLTYWLLGGMLALVFMLSKYILGRFSALESQVSQNQAHFVKHQDIERYIKPLEKQIDQMNARMDKMIDLQMEFLKSNRGDK